jgi:uncharacterized membrane protein YhfC
MDKLFANPLTFIGSPDWRSLLMALAFSLPWLLLLAGPLRRRLWLWVAMAAGAVAFPVSIAWVQVPVQQGLNYFWQALLPGPPGAPLIYAIAIPSIAVSGLVQEATKLALAVLALRLAGVRRAAVSTAVAAGVATGAGYGGMEAFWVFNTIWSMGWNWGVVQLAGLAGLLGFAERFITVPFHIGAAAISAYGYGVRRPWRFWLLASGLHALLNYSAILVQTGAFSSLGTEAWVFFISALTAAAALRLRSGASSAGAPAGPAASPATQS